MMKQVSLDSSDQDLLERGDLGSMSFRSHAGMKAGLVTVASASNWVSAGLFSYR
jgi:hypothetical protein